MAAAKKPKKAQKISSAAGPLRRFQHKPEFAAGIVLADPDGILAIARGHLTPQRLDYGIPAKLQTFREYPEQTARRALLEEAGLYVAGPLIPLVMVPPEQGAAGVPLVVYRPGGPVQGQVRGSDSGVARVIPLSQFLSLHMSHAASNRLIVQSLFGPVMG